MSSPALTPFGPGIWLADGSEVEVAGFRYPTRMAAIQLAGGGLLIWSPILLSDSLREALTALGEVEHLVAPNSLHHLFIPEWQGAWPMARLYAAPGLAERRPDLRIDYELDDAPPAEWFGVLDQAVVRGNKITTEVVFFHSPSSTVLFTDLLQHFPSGWFRGWRALVARVDLMTEAEPAVPRKFRLAFTDRPTARRALARILAWPAVRLVMAHGATVEQDAQALLRRAFRWLMGKTEPA